MSPESSQSPGDALDRLASSGHASDLSGQLGHDPTMHQPGPRSRSVHTPATSAGESPWTHGPADAVAADVGLNRHQIRSEHQGPDRLGNLPFVGLSVKGLGDSLVLMTHDAREFIAAPTPCPSRCVASDRRSICMVICSIPALAPTASVGRGAFLPGHRSSTGPPVHGRNIDGISSGGGSFQVGGESSRWDSHSSMSGTRASAIGTGFSELLVLSRPDVVRGTTRMIRFGRSTSATWSRSSSFFRRPQSRPTQTANRRRARHSPTPFSSPRPRVARRTAGRFRPSLDISCPRVEGVGPIASSESS